MQKTVTEPKATKDVFEARFREVPTQDRQRATDCSIRDDVWYAPQQSWSKMRGSKGHMNHRAQINQAGWQSTAVRSANTSARVRISLPPVEPVDDVGTSYD